MISVTRFDQCPSEKKIQCNRDGRAVRVIYYNLPLARHWHFTPVRDKEKAERLQGKKKKEQMRQKQRTELKCKESGLLFDDAMI